MELVGSLVSAVIGGLIAAGASWWVVWDQRRAARSSMLSALAMEIASLIALVRLNKYSDILRESATLLRNPMNTAPDPFSLQAEQQYFSVFEANAGQIGLLSPELAARIVGFYQAGRSLVDTLHRDEMADLATMQRSDQDLCDGIANRIDNWCAYGDAVLEKLSSASERAEVAESIRLLLGPNAV